MRVLTKVFLVTALAFMPGTLLASGAEAQAVDLVPYAINFVLYIALLYFLLRKSAPKFWKSRVDQLEAEVTESRGKLEKAEKIYIETGKRIEQLESQLSSITGQVEQEGRQEAAYILEQAKLEAERLIQQAERMAEAEGKKQYDMLQKEFIESVIDDAQRKLRETVTFESDREFRNQAVNRISLILNERN